MAHGRRDDDKPEPSAEVEQVKNDTDAGPTDPEDPERVADDALMDDRFQATDN